MPSFAWEGGIKVYTNPSLAQSFSPDGYYQWSSPIENLDVIRKKLELLTRIEKNQPDQAVFSISSLATLRQKIIQALVVGNKEIAEENLTILDQSKLESALNIEILKIKTLCLYLLNECQHQTGRIMEDLRFLDSRTEMAMDTDQV